ncbi:MAG: LPS export ABC transporter periplasmic protein LptC [Alphaproteobacteria bacterium GM7ARS4]|nr:LPS export ABC transporter periplasmic protein LptC [Alphaproteobacteria bacterium GM7ARS4]
MTEDAIAVSTTQSYVKRSHRFRITWGIIFCLALSAVFLWPHAYNIPALLHTNATHTPLHHMPDIMAKNPVYTGYNEKGDLYTIHAKTATMADKKTGHINLTALATSLTDALSGEKITLEADHGIFNNKDKTLTLRDDIHLISQARYHFQTDTLIIRIDQKRIYSDHMVYGRSSLGTITAQGVDISHQGKRVLFKGETLMTMFPKNVTKEARRETF